MNPREKRPGDRRTLGPGNRPGSAVWYVLGALLVMALMQAWFLAPSGRQISYSEFKQAVRGGQVAEVTVGDQVVRGTYKRDVNGQRNFNASRIEDPKLLEELDAAGVKYTGEFVSRWLPEVLGWVLPILILIAIWSFFFRRMSGAEGGVMSFARSKHRVFAEDDVKVSFADVAGVDEAEQELKEIVEFLQDPEEVHRARRPHSEGRAAGRPARHRQDAAGARRGRRSQGALLQHERIRVRRDVRRRRRRARARSVPAGRGEGALHHLHRRARRARARARAEPDGVARRARADAQPAARRDGRLRLAQGDHHHGRDQPPRGARPCPAPPRPLRPAGARGQAGRQGARGGPPHPHA